MLTDNCCLTASPERGIQRWDEKEEKRETVDAIAVVGSAGGGEFLFAPRGGRG